MTTPSAAVSKRPPAAGILTSPAFVLLCLHGRSLVVVLITPLALVPSRSQNMPAFVLPEQLLSVVDVEEQKGGGEEEEEGGKKVSSKTCQSFFIVIFFFLFGNEF